MTIYLGELGRMIELWSTPSSQVQADDPYTFQTTLEGRRRAQRRPTGRRVWGVSAAFSTPAQAALLEDFASGAWGPGPWRFIPADAPTANLLTPQAASSDPHAGMRSTDAPDGPLRTPDGWAPRSIRSTDTSQVLWFGEEHVPVVDDSPVTVSAYVLGEGAAVRIYWYNADGTNTATTTSSVTATAGTAVRSYATASPPTGTASLRVRAVNAVQGARPAVTWGSELYPWANGRGCLRAVVHAVSHDALLAGSGASRQFGDVSYTVTEVG